MVSAAYGGLQMVEFNPDGRVFVDPVVCTAEARRELNRRLRDAREVLSKLKAKTCDKAAVLRPVCGIARELRDVLRTGCDLNVFGRLLHSGWEAKKPLESPISNSRIDEYCEQGLRSGALQGKLLGVAGVLPFFCEPRQQARLREELSDLKEVQFSLDPQGSKILYIGSDPL
jgi:D-glycero-alpha-D-manno-heptose-7-phosphate kinase